MLEVLAEKLRSFEHSFLSWETKHRPIYFRIDLELHFGRVILQIPSLRSQFSLKLYILSRISQPQLAMHNSRTLHSTAVAHDIHIRSRHLRKTLFLIKHTALNSRSMHSLCRRFPPELSKTGSANSARPSNYDMTFQLLNFGAHPLLLKRSPQFSLQSNSFRQLHSLVYVLLALVPIFRICFPSDHYANFSNPLLRMKYVGHYDYPLV